MKKNLEELIKEYESHGATSSASAPFVAYIANELKVAMNDDNKILELLKEFKKHNDFTNMDTAEIVSCLSSDEMKVEFILGNFRVGNFPDDLYIATIVSSLSNDDEKLQWLKDIKSCKSIVISSLSSDDKKIELLENIIRDDEREEIVASISDDDKKIEYLSRVPWWNRRLNIILTLKSDDKKVQFLEKYKDERDKAEIIKSLSDNDKKISLMDKLSDSSYKTEILESIPSDAKYDEVKFQFLNHLYDELKNDPDMDTQSIKQVYINTCEDLVDSISSEDKKKQILEKFNINDEKKVEENQEVNTIDIAQLGSEIGMEVKEQKLPNGKVVTALVWDQENLLKAVNAVKHLSEEGKPVRITGVAPAWLVSALTHTVHPCPVGLYVPQIGKDVEIPQLSHGETNPQGEVAFKTTETGDAVLIEYNMDLPEGITTYDENNLSKVVVPEIAPGKAVYLSGRAPNYLTVAIAEAYAHTNSSVSLFQPGVGYTCSITHSRNKKLGDLTKDPLGKEAIKEQLVESQKQSQDIIVE